MSRRLLIQLPPRLRVLGFGKLDGIAQGVCPADDPAARAFNGPVLDAVFDQRLSLDHARADVDDVPHRVEALVERDPVVDAELDESKWPILILPMTADTRSSCPYLVPETVSDLDFRLARSALPLIVWGEAAQRPARRNTTKSHERTAMKDTQNPDRVPPHDPVTRGDATAYAFASRLVRTADGCWEWRGALSKGYGSLRVDGRVEYAHRYLWQLINGPVPEGLELDHICRNPACVRPTHLEAVTHHENLRRGMVPWAVTARTGQCKRGHSMADAYLQANGKRRCRTCHTTSQRESYRRRRHGSTTSTGATA